eukprot:scaffold1060_cov109-Cylindrotheca_fusiformis.AAC.1
MKLSPTTTAAAVSFVLLMAAVLLRMDYSQQQQQGAAAATVSKQSFVSLIWRQHEEGTTTTKKKNLRNIVDPTSSSIIQKNEHGRTVEDLSSIHGPDVGSSSSVNKNRRSLSTKNSSWVQAASFFEEHVVANFTEGIDGYRLSMSGDGTFLAAAPQYYNNNTTTTTTSSNGMVRFFQKQQQEPTDGASYWEEVTSLQLSDAGNNATTTSRNDYFGCDVSVSYDGTRVAIGAWGRRRRDDDDEDEDDIVSNDEEETNFGIVSMYERMDSINGSTFSWKLLQVIYAESNDDGDSDDATSMGKAVAVALSKDGSIVAVASTVGAPYDYYHYYNDDHDDVETGYYQSGHIVRVYEWNVEDLTFQQLGKDIMNGELCMDDTVGCGSTVLAISDDGLVVAVGGGMKAGGHVVRVFYWDGNEANEWLQRGSDIDGGVDYDDDDDSFDCYYSVALSDDGTMLAVGGTGVNNNTDADEYNCSTSIGATRVFQWNDSNSTSAWEQVGQTLNGTSVSLSSSGSILAVGSKYNIKPSPFGDFVPTMVYTFMDNNNTWQALADGPFGNIPGTEVSLSNDGRTLAIGAAPNGEGIVSIYNLVKDNTTSGSNGDPHCKLLSCRIIIDYVLWDYAHNCILSLFLFLKPISPNVEGWTL